MRLFCLFVFLRTFDITKWRNTSYNVERAFRLLCFLQNNDDSEGSEGTSDEEDVPELDQIEEEENIEPAEMDSDQFQITELVSVFFQK